MTTATGKSRARDPGDRARYIDADTGQLTLPASSTGGIYTAPAPPPWTMSVLLASSLCIAILLVFAIAALALVEEARNKPVVTGTTMLVLTASAAVSWMAVVVVACRDRLDRCVQSLRGSSETLQNRQTELYRRQDHLVHRFNDLANRQAEMMRLLRQVAEDAAATRQEMADVIGVADADAELSVRHQTVVNGNRPAGGLYIVPPEG